jgi:hypothetical protein
MLNKLNYLKERLDRFSRWKKGLVLSSLIVALLSVGAVLAVGAKALNKTETVVSPAIPDSNSFKSVVVSPNEPKDTPNPINGVLFTKTEAESWKGKVPLAVMIENLVSVRPQSGLSKAEVVYEALAEGGITRFMAIFLANNAELGPIRSARAYYLDWLSEYGAGYAHWGGSPEAMDLIRAYQVKDLDQFSLGAPTYWRVRDREAPHNGYTNTEKLWEAAGKKGYNSLANFDSWKFKKDATDSARLASTIKIKFTGSAPYEVVWKYDSEKNSYLRENGGQAHLDKTNEEQLSAKNVIVQSVTANTYDNYGRLRMDTIGEGELKVFRDGSLIEGTWKKLSREGRTKFYDKEGKEIELNRGQIWIEIIPSSQGSVRNVGLEYSS